MAGRHDLIPSFLNAIALELSSIDPGTTVDTLYFGGGTPSQLSSDEFARLANIVLQRFSLEPCAEWTVEANPLDVTVELVNTWRRSGVTRVSLGAQSFNRRKLSALERDHSGKDVRRAASFVQQAGLSLAVDLIFGAPHESLDCWQRDLDQASRLGADHISTYGLTYERGTSYWKRLYHGELVELDEELQRQMYELTIDLLQDAGLEHYEVSNFAHPQRRSRHNENYWLGGGYYAAGPGAARYVDGIRETNHRSTTTYLRRVLAGRSPVAEREQLAPRSRARERLVFGLRRLEGIRRDEFLQATGVDVDELGGEAIRRFTRWGLLYDDGICVRLTRGGLLVSDAMWPELL